MANDLMEIPDFMKAIALESESIFDDARSLGKAMPPMVSSKGQKFNLLVDGAMLWPMSQAHIDFVVVAAKKPWSRAYYEGGYDPANPSPPICYTLDSVTPEDDAGTKQSLSCRTCKHAEWGSKVDERGQSTTACRQHKQLAVKILGAEGIYLLNIPVASIKKQWDVYAARIEEKSKEEKAKYGYATLTLSTLVTTATIDENIWSFKPAGYIGKALKPEEGQELLALIKSKAGTPLLWGPKGAEREQQYLDSSAPGKTAITAPAVPKEEPKAAKKEEPPFDLDGGYVPPGEPVDVRTKNTVQTPVRKKAEPAKKEPEKVAEPAGADFDLDTFLKDL